MNTRVLTVTNDEQDKDQELENLQSHWYTDLERAPQICSVIDNTDLG